MKRFLKNAYNEVGRRRFHARHANFASEALFTIEREQGKTDPALLRLADAYALDKFGDACYAPWLKVYAALNRTFKEGWIPDNYYGWVVVPKLKGAHGQVSGLKSLSRLLFRDEAFPDIAYYVNGLFYDADYIAIPEHEVERAVFRVTDKVIFKLDGSSQSKGAVIIHRGNFNLERIKSLGNGVVQRFVVQHPCFSQFASEAVATIRFTTVVDDCGRVSLRACYLRLGRVAEAIVHPGSEICIAVDLATGELCGSGYLSNWSRTDVHPDSGVPFEGITLPAFSGSVKKVLELHAKVPFARCIGWDAAVSDKGEVVLLEWNGEHNDVKFSEATQGPCFADLDW
jgi:hypothetical protein